MKSKQTVLLALFAILLIVHGSLGFSHGDHALSPASELSDNPTILKLSDERGKVEAWYDPTPIGKRANVVLKVYNKMNALTPERLQGAWIQLDDGVTSYPMKISEDAEVANHLFVQALPTENPQSFILELSNEEAGYSQIILSGFEAAEPNEAIQPANQTTEQNEVQSTSASTFIMLLALLFFGGGAFLWLKKMRN